MRSARARGDRLSILALQRIFDSQQLQRSRHMVAAPGGGLFPSPLGAICGICFDPLELPRCHTLDFSISAANTTGVFRWPGPCSHFFHGQCLTDFRARTSPANLTCPSCRAPLYDSGLAYLDILPYRPTPNEPLPENQPSSDRANSNLARQLELRSAPGSSNSSLPRTVAFCCPHLLSAHSDVRRLVPLSWAPDLNHIGDVQIPMWLCEVCNSPLLWTDFVAAAQFPVSNEFLDMIGSCADHRASARFRVRRSPGSRNLETSVQYQCGCQVSMGEISALVSSACLPISSASGVQPAVVGTVAAPPSEVAGSRAAALECEPPARPSAPLPELPIASVSMYPPAVMGETFSAVFNPFLYRVAGLLSEDCWNSWSVEDPRSRNWWDRAVQAMIAGLRPVLIGEIVATALEEGSLEELSPLGRATVDA